jgi:hypothetical protein
MCSKLHKQTFMLELRIFTPEVNWVVCHVGYITDCKELKSENLGQSCIKQSSGPLKVSWMTIIMWRASESRNI